MGLETPEGRGGEGRREFDKKMGLMGLLRQC